MSCLNLGVAFLNTLLDRCSQSLESIELVQADHWKGGTFQSLEMRYRPIIGKEVHANHWKGVQANHWKGASEKVWVNEASY